jgi:hypothetical protein
MAESILKSDAEKILLSAFRQRCTKKDIISSNIRAVLQGDHKTYKYILVNGLLAKATNESINALALQAGALLIGAYDARSLCHNVLVPFERDFLQNALGGSNEPFLNKPARFSHLSAQNAVRRGKDKETLQTLIGIFNSINMSSQAMEYLACALEFLNKKIEENNLLNDSQIKYNPTLVEIYEFVVRLLDKSFEGETSAIIVGALEKLYHSKFSKNFEVIAHKVNQSGLSSKEVGDIDIYKEGIFYYSVEVKDKKFTPYDLEHAFKKIQEYGGIKGQFIFGPNASFESSALEKRILAFEQEGFMVLFQHIVIYSKAMIFKIDLSSKQEFIDAIISTAIEVNAKNATKAWIQELLANLGWK